MAKDEEGEVACPVCGKTVGLDVSSCPYCGAEFEEEEIAEVVEQPVQGAPVASDEIEEVACPVCGMTVGVDIVCCPRCGAEFEEEEIEEVIEVEEKAVFEAKPEPVRAKPKPKAKAAPRPTPKPAPKAKKVSPAKAPSPAADQPASIMDLRVIGLSLVILGIVGTQVALMIDWYWSWVPPIEDNLALFVVIPVVLLVVGILAFVLVKKAMSGGRRMPANVPGLSLSLFLFGILALIVMVMWDPINSAMEDSQALVAGAFAVALVIGIVFMFLGSRRASAKAAYE